MLLAFSEIPSEARDLYNNEKGWDSPPLDHLSTEPAQARVPVPHESGLGMGEPLDDLGYRDPSPSQRALRVGISEDNSIRRATHPCAQRLLARSQLIDQIGLDLEASSWRFRHGDEAIRRDLDRRINDVFFPIAL
jgi:hypothetical protein